MRRWYERATVLPSPAGTAALARDLARLVDGGRASLDDADRVAYARDLWPRHQITTRAGNAAIAPPAVIVWPASTDEVAAVLRFASTNGLPVVPYGAGSGVCAGVLPRPDTIVLDMKRMRGLLDVDRDRLRCTAQAGIVGQHIEDRLDAQGFTLGHFPSSIYCSTLGGWLAARSAGQCSGRYGKIEDMVTRLTCVDGRGEVLHADRDGEEAALLPLFVGSEGILGVVTEATLRIAPAPRERAFSTWLFPHTEDGLDAIRDIYQAGLRPAVARLYDPFDSAIARRGGVRASDALREAADEAEASRADIDHAHGPGRGVRVLTKLLRRPQALNQLIEHIPDRVLGGARLILAWESDLALAAAERAAAESICLRHDGKDTGEEPGRHWLRHRHSVSYRQSPLFAAGAFLDTMEVAASWSRMVPMYRAVRAALGPHVFVMAHFSHAYPDGASIYFTFAGATKDDATAARTYDLAWERALAAVIDHGATLSHHHGVGRSKAPMMRREQGPAVDVVHELKGVMDPRGVLNEGSLIGHHQARPDARAASDGAPHPSGAGTFVEALRSAFDDASLSADDAATGDASLLLRPADRRRLGRAIELARALGGRLQPPGADPRPGAVRVALDRMTTIGPVDESSRIVRAEAGAAVAAVEAECRRHGWTLGLRPAPDATLDVGTWLARGAPGLPSKDDDPVAQVVAGAELVLPDGRALDIRPAPRRAVGPDLLGALVGARSRLGVVTALHLVARSDRPSEQLAFRYADPAGAERTLAAIRGAGVRPLAGRVVTDPAPTDTAQGPNRPEATALVLTLEEGGPVASAARALSVRLAREHGGVPARMPVDAQRDVPAERPALDPPPLSSVVAALADAIDPTRVLGG